MKFEYRGPGRPPIAAEVVGAELERIHEQNDGITPQVVVEQARPDASPLHDQFEWDDQEAAGQYRVSQARQLIRAVVVVPEPEKGETFAPVRAFVSVINEDRQRLYRPITVALQNPAEAEQVKSRLLHELMGIQRRYRDLIDFDAAIAESFGSLQQALAS